MDAEVFSEWLRRRGHRVVRTASSYWFDAVPRVYQAFPFHWLIRPEPGELRELLVGRGALAVRYSAPIAAAPGKVSYHVVLDRDTDYHLGRLRFRARNAVRRGLEHCHIQRIPLRRLADEGWRLQEDTLARQQRRRSMKQNAWERLCRAADGLPGFAAWGAVADGRLIASALAFRIEDTWNVLYAQSLRAYLGTHVNNALFYALSRELCARPETRTVFYGLESLDARESVDAFKFRMSLAARPVRQCVVLSPWLEPLCGAASHRLVRWVARHHRRSSHLTKIEGMMRFVLQGRLPAAAQGWPHCLDRQRATLLATLAEAEGSIPRLSSACGDVDRAR